MPYFLPSGPATIMTSLGCLPMRMSSTVAAVVTASPGKTRDNKRKRLNVTSGEEADSTRKNARGYIKHGNNKLREE